MDGWVKIHRKMMEWEWYKDSNTKAVFLHLLLSASFKDSSFQGKKLEAGQVIIGRKSLAEKLGMSEQSIRTSLNRLKSTNEITIKPTNKYSIVTIVNWASYQLDDAEPTNKLTNELTNNQPTTNQQLTNKQPHYKNVKKVKKEKNVNNYYSLPLDERIKIALGKE